MGTGRTQVVVVPVAVQQAGHEGLPTFVGLAEPDGRWAASPLHDRAGSTAQRLLASVLPPAAALLDDRMPLLRPVTFEEHPDSGGVTLIYTAALPMALTEAVETVGRWRPLVMPAPSADIARAAGGSAVTDVEHAEVLLEHWREVLEDTAGGLLFLARYWTMPQLRDVYSAVWGYEQDAASFNRWADPQGGGAFEGVVEPPDKAPAAVTDEIAKVFAIASHLPPGMAAGLVAGAAVGYAANAQTLAPWKAVATVLRPKKRVGLAVTQGDGAYAAVSKTAMVAAAARVAYQASTRGPAPDWYTARIEHPHQHRLDKLYLPRPGWMHRKTAEAAQTARG